MTLAASLAAQQRMIEAMRAFTDAPPIDGARDYRKIDLDTYRAVKAFAERKHNAD